MSAFDGPLVFATHRRERMALATRTLTLRAGQPALQTDGAALPPLPQLKVVT